MSAVTDARASKVSEADKLVAWYERMLLETRRPPWWLQVPQFVILMATWPLLVIIAAVRLSYRIAINPQSWPEAAAFIAAIIAILIVPTSGPGPLLVTGAHLAIVTWLRRNVKD